MNDDIVWIKKSDAHVAIGKSVQTLYNWIEKHGWQERQSDDEYLEIGVPKKYITNPIFLTVQKIEETNSNPGTNALQIYQQVRSDFEQSHKREVELLEKALKHAESRIQTLEARNEELNNDLGNHKSAIQKHKSMEEYMEEIRAKLEKNSSKPWWKLW